MEDQTTVSPKTGLLEKHPRAVFWTRMFAWIGTSVGAPIAVFAKKFGLFTVNKSVYDELGNPIIEESISLNGWGILSCILVGWMGIQILKEIRKAYSEYSFTKQCLDGVIHSVLPLLVGYGVCFFLKGVIEQIMYCIAILIACKIAAVPLNPLPKWRYDTTGVEDYGDAFSELVKMLRKENKP